MEGSGAAGCFAGFHHVGGGSCPAGLPQFVGGGHRTALDCRGGAGFRQQEGGHVEIRCGPGTLESRSLAQIPEVGSLGLDLPHRVLPQVAQAGKRQRQGLQSWNDGGAAAQIQFDLAPLCGAVGSFVVVGGGFVVAGQGLVGGVGNAVCQHAQVNQAQQGIAAANLPIQKTQGEAGGHRLDPEGHTGQLHSHGVLVHPVETATGHVPQGRAEVRQPWGAVGADAGQAGGQATGGGQQKVARAAGRVQDGELEERRGGVGGFRFGAVQNGVKGAVQQRLNQAVRGVVGARGFALVASPFAGLGGKHQAAAVVRQLGLEFQEGFIHRAQFFGFHGPPVDRHPAGPLR